MRWSSIAAIYALFWAFSFFLVLPFRLSDRRADALGALRADGAPSGFSFARTARWTTLVSAILFGLYYANYVNQWVPVQAFNFVPRAMIEGH